MFTAHPSYSPYRSLRLLPHRMRGEDVYALQTGLGEVLAGDVEPDGVLGPVTAGALEDGQRALNLLDDGVCGPQTWGKLTDVIARHYKAVHSVASGALYGSLSHESSLRGGSYSPQRPDHSYDAGVAQLNTSFTPPDKGFDMAYAIEKLAKDTREFYEEFEGVADLRRRWNLAQGAWNAPAFARYYARAEGADLIPSRNTAKPGPAAAEKFADYLASVGAYLRV